jgi:hypothetical protein
MPSVRSEHDTVLQHRSFARAHVPTARLFRSTKCRGPAVAVTSNSARCHSLQFLSWPFGDCLRNVPTSAVTAWTLPAQLAAGRAKVEQANERAADR